MISTDVRPQITLHTMKTQVKIKVTILLAIYYTRATETNKQLLLKNVPKV